MPDTFQFTRLDGARKLRSSSLAQTMGVADPARETWLFVSPHDDDTCLGGGLWLLAAVAAHVNVHVLIVTDGRMGYCSMDQQQRIVEIRREETYESFALLGLESARVQYIGYPDCNLLAYQGRRKANPGEASLCGHVGLQNAFTHHLRAIRPTRVLLPTSADLHPDHRITHSEMMISIFHAAGPIWPELGTPLARPPSVIELANYCEFPAPPTLELKSADAPFQRKLASIAAFRSQPQINLLADDVRASGPVEYLRELNFRFYTPALYKPLFA